MMRFAVITYTVDEDIFWENNKTIPLKCLLKIDKNYTLKEF